MKTKWKVQLMLGIACLVLGFLVTVQYKSVTRDTLSSNDQTGRTDELVAQIKVEQDKVADLKAQVEAYKTDLGSAKEQTGKTNEQGKAMEERLKSYEIMSGMREVYGPGISIVLSDSNVKTKTGDSVNKNQYLVHDEDILKVVNELRASGAESISVNNNRLVSTSAIRCAGPIILVNDVRLAPPYEIKAIGDADKLAAAMGLPGGVIEYLKNIFGFDITVTKSENISIVGFDGALHFKYAIPVYESQAPKKEGGE